MADKEVLETEQGSPTVEQPAESETAEKLEETPEEEALEQPQETSQEKNWRALREENDRLKKELEAKPVELQEAKRSQVVSAFLTSEDNVALQLNEFKAEQSFPELESNKLFAKAVAGEYRAALDKYTQDVISGKPAQLPDVFKITKQVKSEWDSEFGSISKKAELEGAKKANEAKQLVESTVEPDVRSDRARLASATRELNDLKELSRTGDYNAVAERLARSGL